MHRGRAAAATTPRTFPPVGAGATDSKTPAWMGQTGEQGKGYPMNTSQTLNAAADLIQARGWGTQVDAWGGDGPLCIEGALLAASGLDRDAMARLWRTDAYRAVTDHLGLPLTGGAYLEGCGNHGLFLWNDAEGRTAAEVVEVLRACAMVEAARERQEVAS
jgi:hypothetical protein